MIFTGTYSPQGKEVVELVGLDRETGEVMFYTTFGGPEDLDKNTDYPELGAGVGGNPIFIHNDVLYYLSWSLAAWDLNSGQRLYRRIFTVDIPDSKMCMANEILQATYDGGKIYYVSFDNYYTPESRNIHCIDAATGELVWNAIAIGSETLDTNPLVIHNRLYVSQASGLRVYEPATGKLIGVDQSFCGAGMGRNVLYNDYMLCVRRDPDNADGRLVAVDVSK
jgi:hypothetical protein